MNLVQPAQQGHLYATININLVKIIINIFYLPSPFSKNSLYLALYFSLYS